MKKTIFAAVLDVLILLGVGWAVYTVLYDYRPTGSVSSRYSLGRR